ncbi:MAG: FAD-binding oxidoreductase, partial [Vicinamibacterales bacterium]
MTVSPISGMDASLLQTERRRFVTFDRGVSAVEAVVRPDRHRLLEQATGVPFVPRGAGYSYAATSFGGGATAVEMSRFNRVLAFDRANGLITVEAGMTIGDLLALAGPDGWWLPVMPGYPAITIGGCVAANVHGKNPGRAGTFRGLVRGITLHHPRHGTVALHTGTDDDLLELTLGGYGLTGVIVSVTLQLDRLPGSTLTLKRRPLASVRDGLGLVMATPHDAAFFYTWHDGAPGRHFGRGIGYHGRFLEGPIDRTQLTRRYRRLDTARARLPFSIWNRWLTPVGNAGYYWMERARSDSARMGVFDSCFPFAGSPAIFRLFGRPGFIEYQAILDAASAADYLAGVERLLGTGRYPSVLVSMKWFAGEQRLLRFERAGVCITVYLVRNSSGLEAAAGLD